MNPPGWCEFDYTSSHTSKKTKKLKKKNTHLSKKRKRDSFEILQHTEAKTYFDKDQFNQIVHTFSDEMIQLKIINTSLQSEDDAMRETHEIDKKAKTLKGGHEFLSSRVNTFIYVFTHLRKNIFTLLKKQNEKPSKMIDAVISGLPSSWNQTKVSNSQNLTMSVPQKKRYENIKKDVYSTLNKNINTNFLFVLKGLKEYFQYNLQDCYLFSLFSKINKWGSRRLQEDSCENDFQAEHCNWLDIGKNSCENKMERFTHQNLLLNNLSKEGNFMSKIQSSSIFNGLIYLVSRQNSKKKCYETDNRLQAILSKLPNSVPSCEGIIYKQAMREIEKYIDQHYTYKSTFSEINGIKSIIGSCPMICRGKQEESNNITNKQNSENKTIWRLFQLIYQEFLIGHQGIYIQDSMLWKTVYDELKEYSKKLPYFKGESLCGDSKNVNKKNINQKLMNLDTMQHEKQNTGKHEPGIKVTPTSISTSFVEKIKDRENSLQEEGQKGLFKFFTQPIASKKSVELVRNTNIITIDQSSFGEDRTIQTEKKETLPKAKTKADTKKELSTCMTNPEIKLSVSPLQDGTRKHSQNMIDKPSKMMCSTISQTCPEYNVNLNLNVNLSLNVNINDQKISSQVPQEQSFMRKKKGRPNGSLARSAQDNKNEQCINNSSLIQNERFLNDVKNYVNNENNHLESGKEYDGIIDRMLEASQRKKPKKEKSSSIIRVDLESLSRPKESISCYMSSKCNGIRDNENDSMQTISDSSENNSVHLHSREIIDDIDRTISSSKSECNSVSASKEQRSRRGKGMIFNVMKTLKEKPVNTPWHKEYQDKRGTTAAIDIESEATCLAISVVKNEAVLDQTDQTFGSMTQSYQSPMMFRKAFQIKPAQSINFEIQKLK